MKIFLSYGHNSNASLIEMIKEYLSKDAEGSLKHDVRRKSRKGRIAQERIPRVFLKAIWCLLDVHIIERYELPDGLLSIGNNTHDITNNNAHYVFADCILSAVVIPDSVKEIGSFAFGHSYTDSLQLPESLHSPYGRQFKDSYIEMLRLPKKWKDGVSIGKYGNLEFSRWRFDNEKYGYLRWPSTTICNLEFY